MTRMDDDRFRMLMMKALDGELAGSEHSEFENFLSDEKRMNEWNKYRKLKEATMSLKMKTPSGEMWDSYWGGVYNRFERGFAWMFVSLGAVVLLTWGSFEAAKGLWENDTMPVMVKAGIIALAAGLFTLFFSVIREKWFTRKHDKYKEVIR